MLMPAKIANASGIEINMFLANCVGQLSKKLCTWTVETLNMLLANCVGQLAKNLCKLTVEN